MCRIVARILVRDGNQAGLFIPMSGHTLKAGLYNLREILGEYDLVYVGDPAMDKKQIEGFSPDGLLMSRESALMTEAERAFLANASSARSPRTPVTPACADHI